MRAIHILFIFGFVFCQTTIEGIPKSFTNSTQNRVEKTIMPEINVAWQAVLPWSDPDASILADLENSLAR